MKFKIGDKVKIINDYHRGGTGIYPWWNILGNFKGKSGHIGSIVSDGSYIVYPEGEYMGYYGYYQEEDLIMENSMENLQNGMILCNKNDEDRLIVLAVNDDIVITADIYDETGDIGYKEVGLLTSDGYYVKGSKPEAPELKEVTLEDVAKSMGIPVEQLRIKDKE